MEKKIKKKNEEKIFEKKNIQEKNIVHLSRQHSKYANEQKNPTEFKKSRKSHFIFICPKPK